MQCTSDPYEHQAGKGSFATGYDKLDVTNFAFVQLAFIVIALRLLSVTTPFYGCLPFPFVESYKLCTPVGVRTRTSRSSIRPVCERSVASLALMVFEDRFRI